MKLSDLETVLNLNKQLSANADNLLYVKDGSFSLNVGGYSVLPTSYVLKARMQQELTDYYIAERDLIWNELKRLGVEVDV